MKVIGLTGGIGSGKSTVADLFRQKGIEVIDADQLAREVVEPGTPALAAIAAHFGEEILDGAGRLRRAALRERVFVNPAERQWLEALLHPLIQELVQARIAQCRSVYCLLMSPLLLESRQKLLVDRILVVDVSRETQLRRTMQRDTSSRETVEAIIAAQISREQRLAAADDIIENDGSRARLVPAVARLHQNYLAMSSQEYLAEGDDP
jgi:dephospho-CoA kinase